MGSHIATVATYVLLAALHVVLSAPPGPLAGINAGPGAPVGSLLEPDAETKSFVEYMESCKHPIRPGNQLCLAYQEIHGFYAKLVPDAVAQSLLRDSFAAYRTSDVPTLCRALSETGPVLKAIAANGTESKFYRTITEQEICARRCGELHEDDDQITLRPVCKVLAYELQEINKKTSAAKVEAPKETKSAGENKTPVISAVKPEAPPLKLDAIISPAVVVAVPPVSSKSSTTAQVVAVEPQQQPVEKQKPSTSATTDEKKPVSITPGTNPQLAEDVAPIAPVAGQKVSTSTVDYSGVLVPNNNEPDDNIKLPSISETSNKSQQSPAGGENKIGGSLDDEQGGQIDPAEDPFMGGNGPDDDGEDGDYGMDEKIPVVEKSNSEKDKQKSAAIEAGDGVGAAVEDTKAEKMPQPPAHNKKPTQVGDSFEVEGRLEEVNHRSKMTEMIDDPFYEETDSNFFAYFMFLMVGCVLAYVVYHNKKKMIAFLLEGRRGSTGRGGGSLGSRSRSRGGGGGGSGNGSSRKHTAAYQKLDSNLEEAITSTGQSRSSQIIY